MEGVGPVGVAAATRIDANFDATRHAQLRTFGERLKLLTWHDQT